MTGWWIGFCVSGLYFLVEGSLGQQILERTQMIPARRCGNVWLDCNLISCDIICSIIPSMTFLMIDFTFTTLTTVWVYRATSLSWKVKKSEKVVNLNTCLAGVQSKRWMNIAVLKNHLNVYPKDEWFPTFLAYLSSQIATSWTKKCFFLLCFIFQGLRRSN